MTSSRLGGNKWKGRCRGVYIVCIDIIYIYIVFFWGGWGRLIYKYHWSIYIYLSYTPQIQNSSWRNAWKSVLSFWEFKVWYIPHWWVPVDAVGSPEPNRKQVLFLMSECFFEPNWVTPISKKWQPCLYHNPSLLLVFFANPAPTPVFIGKIRPRGLLQGHVTFHLFSQCH